MECMSAQKCNIVIISQVMNLDIKNIIDVIYGTDNIYGVFTGKNSNFNMYHIHCMFYLANLDT